MFAEYVFYGFLKSDTVDPRSDKTETTAPPNTSHPERNMNRVNIYDDSDTLCSHEEQFFFCIYKWIYGFICDRHGKEVKLNLKICVLRLYVQIRLCYASGKS